MLHVTCSHCGKKMAVRDEYAGRMGKCVCGAVVSIPDSEQLSAYGFGSSLVVCQEPPKARGEDHAPEEPRRLNGSGGLWSSMSVKQRTWALGGAAMIVLLLVVIIIHGIGVAGDRGPNVRTKVADSNVAGQGEAAQAKLASMPIDLGWQELPLGFHGHDAKLLYEELHKHIGTMLDKDEFDTAEQHDAKLGAALAPPFFGTLNKDSMYGFVVQQEITYSAEKGEFDCPLRGVSGCLGTITYRPEKSYVGENAFGVKKEVSVSTEETLFLDIKKLGDFDDFRLQMGANEARAAKQHLRLLLICNLSPPYLTRSTSWHSPTIDDPRRTTDIFYEIPVTAREIWVVRLDNRQVVRKMKPWVADPKSVMERAVSALERQSWSFKNVTADVRPAAAGWNATLSFRESSGQYNIAYAWETGKWVLKGGSFIKEESGGERKTIQLRAAYGDYGDDAVPHEVESAFPSR